MSSLLVEIQKLFGDSGGDDQREGAHSKSTLRTHMYKYDHHFSAKFAVVLEGARVVALFQRV
eukprot:1800431-Pleurochrysis_carterae.AAC.13